MYFSQREAEPRLLKKQMAQPQKDAF